MEVNLSFREKLFLFGCLGFVAAGFLFSWLLLVGGGFGFLGGFLVAPKYLEWQGKRKRKLYQKRLREVEKLKVELHEV